MTSLLYNNASSLVGTTITWTDDTTTNGCYYNTSYNIYIYPVEDVAASRLENEFDINLVPSVYTTECDVSDNNAVKVKTLWEYNLTEENIDSGKVFACAINTNDLNNIEIESVEVN